MFLLRLVKALRIRSHVMKTPHGRIVIRREYIDPTRNPKKQLFIDKQGTVRVGIKQQLQKKDAAKHYRTGSRANEFVAGRGEAVKRQDLKTIKKLLEHAGKNLQTVHITYETKDGDIKTVNNAEPKSYRDNLLYFINPSGFDPKTNTRGRVLRSFRLGNIYAVHAGDKNYQDDPQFPVEIGRMKKALNLPRPKGTISAATAIDIARKMGWSPEKIAKIGAGLAPRSQRKEWAEKVGRLHNMSNWKIRRFRRQSGT